MFEEAGAVANKILEERPDFCARARVRMKEITLLLKVLPLVLLGACATLRGLGEDFQNMGPGMEEAISEYESKDSSTSSSSQNQASAGELGTAEIREAQERLILAGLDPGHIDGVLGPKTQAALREYQAAHGLQRTGTLDEKTRNAMGL